MESGRFLLACLVLFSLAQSSVCQNTQFSDGGCVYSFTVARGEATCAVGGRQEGADSGREVTELRSAVQALQVTVQGLQSTVQGLQATVQSLQAAAQAKDSTVQGLQGTVQSQQSKVLGLEATFQAQQSAAQAQQATIQGLQDQLTAVMRQQAERETQTTLQLQRIGELEKTRAAAAQQCNTDSPNSKFD